MPTTELYPDSQGTYNGYTLGAGASKPIACQSDDGDTTYVYVTGFNAQTETYFMDALPVNTDQVSQVDTHYKSRRSSGSTHNHQSRIRLSSTNQDGSCVSLTGSYATYTISDQSRPGGGDWTKDDFPGGGSGLEVGFKNCNVVTTDTTRTTQVRATVTYTLLDEGGFLYMLSSVILPVAGALASHGLSPFDFASIMRQSPSDLEKRTAWDRFRPANLGEWELVKRVFKRPTYLDLGGSYVAAR